MGKDDGDSSRSLIDEVPPFDEIVKVAHSPASSSSSNNLKISYKGYNCRPNDFLQLETRKVKRKYGKLTFDYAAPRLWNALPVQVRMENDVQEFKKQVKTLLFVDTEGFVKKAFPYH